MSRRPITARLLPLAWVLIAACSDPALESTPPMLSETPSEVLGGRFTTPDGTELVYDLRGRGETTLVLVHCWACNRGFWKGQVEALSKDYRVLAMDLAGHGESSTGRAAWTVAGLAEDVRGLVGALELERVVLVGHSMGGPIALLAAPLMPERVVGVACADTLHDADAPWDAEALAPILAIYEGDFATANGQFVPMMFPEGADPETIAWVTENANRSDPAAAMALMADFPNLDLPKMLSEVGVPVRCVNAAPLGQIIPPTAIEANRRYADFDATTLEGVGHYLMLERPDEFNDQLVAAVQALERRGAETR